MHVLHICSDFLGTSAHVSLFNELDNLGVVQSIFVPIKKNSDTKRNEINLKAEGSNVYFSRRLGKIDKYLYGLKIHKLQHDLESQIELTKVDVIHASLLCNEGALAYELHKKYQKPYIVSVRNTDINGYIKTFKWRKSYFRKISENASRIVFISSQYPSRLEKSLSIKRDSRFVVIHNGLHSFYTENRNKIPHEIHNPIRIVMTGAFVKNKNIHGAVKAIALLREKGYEVTLNAIGKNLASYNSRSDYPRMIESMSNDYPWFYTKEAQPKELLIESLRNSDIFLLPSFTETFGLSYLEALSQGIPVVYTRGEGFDGTYEDGFIGYSASSRNVESITQAIEKIILNYSQMCKNVINLDFTIYEWGNIAQRYNAMYKEICL